MSEYLYSRIGRRVSRADLLARLAAVDLAIARIQDRLAVCRRNQNAVRDYVETTRIEARVRTYELVLAELGVEVPHKESKP